MLLLWNALCHVLVLQKAYWVLFLPKRCVSRDSGIRDLHFSRAERKVALLGPRVVSRPSLAFPVAISAQYCTNLQTNNKICSKVVTVLW